MDIVPHMYSAAACRASTVYFITKKKAYTLIFYKTNNFNKLNKICMIVLTVTNDKQIVLW